jgi:hypothetical protein
MKGVDKFNQFTSYYALSHKTKRWYLRIAVHLLELALANTYIYYKKGTPSTERLSQLDYRMEVIKSFSHLGDSQEN